MRILNRPMFRYGGPIKEGVMHGMRNGGRAALVGNPVYPQTGGREHHKISMLNPMNWKNIFVGANVAKNPTVGSKVYQGIKNIFGSTTPVTHTPVTRVPGQTFKNTWGINTATKPKWQAGQKVTENIWNPNYLGRTSEAQLAQKLWQGKGLIGKPVKEGVKFLYRTPTASIPLVYFGGKWLMKDGTPAPNQDEINNQVTGGGKAGGVPGGGDPGMTYTDPSKAEALAKAARKARLDKYLDTMGYDKAKKTAMGDALIDASAIVQQGTEEGGSLKHADWGKMINKAIQSTSKRLDKPEQIREAVGLMMTKTDIEKEASAEEDALKKIATKLQIKGLQKTLAGETLQESINASYQRTGKFPTGSTLAGVARTKGIEVTSVIPTKDIPDDMSAIDYISIITEKAKKDGNPMPKGHYVIKDRLVEIDESGDIIKQLI